MPPDPRKLVSSDTGKPIEWDNASMYDRVNYFLEAIRNTPGYSYFDAPLGKAVKLRTIEVSKTDPKIAYATWELDVLPELCNQTGNMHGGAVAMILDNLTSLPIAAVSSKGFWDMGHVSRTINCTYLRPAPMNSKCIVETEIVHLGKGAGMLRGVIKNAEGKVCYTIEHGKVGWSSSEKGKL